MNAPRRPAPLPLPASLLRTLRRLTSSRFSPSGKSLPSSPPVLIASRRLAPLPLLLIVLAVLCLTAALLLIPSDVRAQSPEETPKRVTGFSLHSSNSAARGIWGNDDTFWVANDGSGSANKLYAYNRSDGSRDSGSDFNTLNAANNRSLRGICSDGTTMFVTDHADDKIYAYRMSDTMWDSGKDVTLDGANNNPQGLWCDGSHLWVAEDNDNLTSKIFVYQRSDGSHAATMDLGAPVLNPSSSDGTVNNNDQRGLWSNGATLFVVDNGDNQVYGYRLSDRTRDDAKNLSLDTGNTSPEGLWFDGRVLWVVDSGDDRLYAYDLPGAQPGNTAALGVPAVRTGAAEDAWTATLTAGANSGFGAGYSALLNPNIGSLSPAAFELDGVAYTVQNLYLQLAGHLAFDLDKELPLHFTLSLGGESFSSVGHGFPNTSGVYRYMWGNPGLSWSASDTVSVVLSVDAAPVEAGEVRADVSGITNPDDGLADATFHYQWLRVDGATETELDGETGATYTPVAADVGRDLKVRVVFDDDAGFKEYPRASRGVGPVAANPAVTVSFERAGYLVAEGGAVTVRVRLDGDPRREVIVPLTAVNQGGASAADYDGVPAGVTFRSGDTEQSFTITATKETVAEEGESVKLGFGALPDRVSAGAVSEATVSITDDNATGAPTISGTPQVGETLTADTSAIADSDGTTSATFTYQWVRVDGEDETNVGTDSAVYTLTDEDANRRVRVDVSFTDDLGNPEGPLSSALTAGIAPAGVRVLVNNTASPFGAGSLTAIETIVAQAFGTGPNPAGYDVQSIAFRFGAIADTDAAAAQLRVDIYDRANGEPGSSLCTLTNPGSFSASGKHTFTVPAAAPRCPTLAPNATYYAAVTSVNPGSSVISLSWSLSAVSAAAPGWSVGNTRIFDTSTGNWFATSAPRIFEIQGTVNTVVPVPGDWPLTPSGLEPGDEFRLLFLTAAGHPPTSTGIGDYNAYAQSQAAAGHQDIRDYSAWFRALGSTADVDAIDNTETAHTADDQGVPVYWLGGNRVADDYEDFYDGGWGDETNPTKGDGTAATPGRVWTGSDGAGAEAFHTDSASLALGSAGSVRVGELNNSAEGFGPVSTSENYAAGTSLPYYALSGLFVVPPANNPATGLPAIVGTPRVGRTLSADTGGVADLDGAGDLSYRWLRVQGADATEISGAASATYTLTEQDLDRRIRVEVAFTDGLGYNEGPLASPDTAPVIAADAIVQNTQQAQSPVRPGLDTNQPKRAQAFSTGPGADVHQLHSVDFLFAAIADPSTAAGQVAVTLNADDGGSPGRALCTLINPASFAGSGMHTFTAPTIDSARCPLLEPDTTYFAVIERTAFTPGSILLATTLSAGEHPDSARGWSIGDSRHYFDANPPAWASSTQGTHQVRVRGRAVREIIVPGDWPLIPDGLAAGDRFRLLFVTGLGHRPTSSDIDTYNAYARSQAAGGHAAVRPYSHWFRILGSTAAVNARDNTGTAGFASSNRGFPIHWLNGNRVADDYAGLYDGAWDDEANPTGSDGSTVSPGWVWTGSGSTGGFIGDGSTLGGQLVASGYLNHGVRTPLNALRTASPGQFDYRYYALSGVFRVGEPVSPHRGWVDNRHGDASAEYANTGGYAVAQGFRTGDTAGIFEVHEISVDFDRGQPAGAVQVRIVESTAPNEDWAYATPFHFRRGGNYPAQAVANGGVHTFRRDSGNSALRANTNYFLVIESTNNDPADAAVVRMTGYEGEVSDDGWTVDDHSHSKAKQPNATWTRQDHQVRFRIAGGYREGIGMAGDSYAFESCPEVRRGEATGCTVLIVAPEPDDPDDPSSWPKDTVKSSLVLEPELFPEITKWWTGWWTRVYETLDFQVSMHPLPTGADYVTLSYRTAGDSAQHPVDFIGAQGSLRFDANGPHSHTVSLRIRDDAEEDSGEYMFFSLDNCKDQNGASCDHLFVDDHVKGIIYNTEESKEISYLQVSDVTATEGEGATAQFTVSLTSPVTAAVSFEYATEDGTARDGADYTGGSGTAFIGNGDTSVTISVDIANDDTWTGERSFTLKISDAVHAAISDDTGVATIRDDDPQPLTARFANLPEGNHGETSFTFNISFNQDVATRYLVMQEDVLTVTNGAVTGAQRINGARDFWRITVEPDSGEDVAVHLPATTDCSAAGAVCTGGDNPQPLSNGVTHTFPGTELHAEFTRFDFHHDGKTPLRIHLTFSEEVDTDAAEIKDHALSVTGGGITSVAKRDEESARRWVIMVKPNGAGNVELAIGRAADCEQDGHICTADGELLASGDRKASSGPPVISVADATVTEGDGAQLAFAVTLDRSWFGPAPTVSYNTSDGTASAGSDYTASSGTLTLGWTRTGSLTSPWALTGAITVPVTDDALTEDPETLTLTLSGPEWATLGDSAATGAIEDDDVTVAREPDSGPTGLPVITGAFQADETLTADTSAIDDANGLTGVSYTYQWIMTTGGADPGIDGATAPTHTPRAAHAGRTFRVRVSFTDDDDYRHTLTSEPTTPITKPADATTVWSADMLVVEYTDISIGAASADLFSNIGGSGNLRIKSLWSYVPDKDLRLAFTDAFDAAGDHTLIVGDLTLEFPAGSSGEQTFKWTGVDLDWEDGQTIAVSIVPTPPVETTPNTAATGAPAINGTPQVGVTLTADVSGIADADGLDNVSYGYQWIANDGTADTDLQEATASTYTPPVSDVGKTIRVRVTFNDDAGNDETLTSEATVAVAATVPTAPLSLTVATGDQIQELDASWQAPSSNGGSAVTGYRVQWKEAADSWDTAGDVSRAAETGTAYTITGLTGGVEYAVRVIATNDAGDGPASAEAKGTPSGGVSEQTVEPENSAPTGLPAIGGTPQVGETLTASTSDIADADGLDDVSYSYRWTAGGSDIEGATSSTYTPADGDAGKTIQVRVSFTDDAGNAEFLTSAATEAVAAKPAPLTAGFSDAPDSHDGQTAFTFELRFSEEFGISYLTLRDHAFSVTGGMVNKARRMTQGSNIGWTITVTPGGNAAVTVVLPVTTDCNANGAVCTADGRKLSNRNGFTVSGSGG